MTATACRDVLDRIEPIAAGDLAPDDGVRAHLESCTRCAAALASARRVEQALLTLAVPSPPVRFTPTVLARVRRERWRSEQNLDRLFNVAVAFALLLIAGGMYALLNVSGVVSGGRLVWTVLASFSSEAIDHVAPALATYVAAAGLLASALGMWWWADRSLNLQG
jgi:anti-sigma factor RsiW